LLEALEAVVVLGLRAPMDSLDLKEIKGSQGHREIQDRLDPAEFQDRQALLELQDPKVRKGQLVRSDKPVSTVLPDLLALQVPTVHQVFLDQRELQDQQVRRVLLEIQDLLGLSDPMVLQVVKAPVGFRA